MNHKSHLPQSRGQLRLSLMRLQWVRCQEWCGGRHTCLTLSICQSVDVDMKSDSHWHTTSVSSEFCTHSFRNSIRCYYVSALIYLSVTISLSHLTSHYMNVMLTQLNVSIWTGHSEILSARLTSLSWRGWGQVSDRHCPWRRQRVFCLSQVFWCRNDIACRTHTSVNGAGLVISAVSPSSFLLCNATPPMQCSKQIQHCRPEEKWNTAQKEMTGGERWGEV